MKEELKTSELIKNIFQNNWNEKFIYDSIDNDSFSFGEFFSMVLHYKKILEKMGIQKNHIVCLLMSNSSDVLFIYFAALLLQVTVVSIDPNRGKDGINEMLLQIKYNLIITNTSNVNLPSNVMHLEKINRNTCKKRDDDINQLNIFNELNYDYPFIITFTSGSTGKSKGVINSFNNFIQSSNAFKQRFNFNKTNIFYHNLPMSYIGGILNLVILPFISESKIVLSKQFDISSMMNFWEVPIKYSVNTFWFIPTIIALLLKIDRSNNGIEYSEKNNIIGLVGTAALKSDIKIEFQKKYHIPLYESYGLSETFFLATNYPNNDKIGSAGKLLDGVKISFSQQNEILIEVPWMFLGYVGLDNDQFFDNHKYLSGDIGHLDNDGFLTITDRKKDLIIRGGLNISPRKIEEFLLTYTIFEETAVFGIENTYLGEKTVCAFVRNKGKYDEKELKNINKEIMTRYGTDYQIDEFFELDFIPKTLNGKVDKPTMRELYKNKK